MAPSGTELTTTDVNETSTEILATTENFIQLTTHGPEGVPYETTNNETEPSLKDTLISSNNVLHHDSVLRLTLTCVALLMILALALLIIYIYRHKRHVRLKKKSNRRQRIRNSIYEHNVDIIGPEIAMDMHVMERAFGNGVLVIDDSPMMHRRLTDMPSTNIGLRQKDYLSTAESDYETIS